MLLTIAILWLLAMVWLCSIAWYELTKTSRERRKL